MSRFKLRGIAYGSYVKVNILGSLFIGLIVALLVLPFTYFFKGFFTTPIIPILEQDLSGIQLGITNVIVLPVALMLVTWLVATINYLGFRVYLLIFRSTKVSARGFEVVSKKKEPKPEKEKKHKVTEPEVVEQPKEVEAEAVEEEKTSDAD